MTIDEAIKFCHEKSENIKLKAEPQVFIDIANMLEELKEYKATNYPKCSECAGCTLWNCDCANVRDKAIDEFASELVNHSIMGDIGIGNAVKMEWVSPIERIIEVAEQLKAGDKDGM